MRRRCERFFSLALLFQQQQQQQQQRRRPTATLSGQSSDCFLVGGIASLDIMQDRRTTAITAATSVALAAVLRAPPH